MDWTIDPPEPYEATVVWIDPVKEMLMGRDELAEIEEAEAYEMEQERIREIEREELYRWYLEEAA